MLAGGCHYAKRPHRTYGKIHMITLFGFGAGFGLPEISPYVTKTEVQLKMAGIGAWDIRAVRHQEFGNLQPISFRSLMQRNFSVGWRIN